MEGYIGVLVADVANGQKYPHQPLQSKEALKTMLKATVLVDVKRKL